MVVINKCFYMKLLIDNFFIQIKVSRPFRVSDYSFKHVQSHCSTHTGLLPRRIPCVLMDIYYDCICE